MTRSSTVWTGSSACWSPWPRQVSKREHKTSCITQRLLMVSPRREKSLDINVKFTVVDTSVVATERLSRPIDALAKDVKALVLEVSGLSETSEKATKLATVAAGDAHKAAKSATSSAASANLAATTARDFCTEQNQNKWGARCCLGGAGEDNSTGKRTWRQSVRVLSLKTKCNLRSRTTATTEAGDGRSSRGVFVFCVSCRRDNGGRGGE